LPVILQPSDLSSSVQLRVVYVPAAIAGGSADSPATGYSSRAWDLRPDDLPAAIEAAAAFEATPLLTQPLSPVPALRLEQEFARLTSPPGSTPEASPVLVAVAGRMEVDDVRRQLAEAFGKIHPQAVKHLAVALPRDAIAIRLGTPVAQAQWGYIAAAPGPGEAAADAWRLLLYILSHDYEGRLGRKAISEAGLAYYIDSQYRSDGMNAWLTLSTGVDPEKLGAFKELFDHELARLRSEPPTAAEVEEAKQHLLGRYRSAAQSNGELTRKLAREWLWYGELPSYEKLEARLSRVDRDDVLRAVEGLRGGLGITVTE
jgi:hypothetical protein